MKIDRNDIRLINSSDLNKGNLREALRCLVVKDGYVASADGFMLAKRKALLDEKERELEVLLPASMVKNIKLRGDQTIDLVIEDNKATVNYSGLLEYEPKYQFNLCKEKYPDYQKLIKDVPTEKKAKIAVSVKLLKQLVKVLPDDGICRIGITDVDKPLEYSCDVDGRPIEGLIMPMYVDWGGFEWER